MSLKKICNGEGVHTRNISVTTHADGMDGIVVEGVLKDDRLGHHYTYKREKLPPGTIHHMVIRIRVTGRKLTIEEIAVEMPGTPHGDCSELKSSLDELVGIRIAPGFTEKVKMKVGGVKGCVHLTGLLLTMAPAAVQGYWANRSQNPDAGHITLDALEQYLIDTCRVWRRDGPLVESVKSAVGDRS